MSPSGRHGCRCTRCDCPSSAYHAGDPCPSCQAGFHRPSREVQEHVRAGLVEWIRILPFTAGSSGLSDRQLAQTAEVWTEWHRTQPCPIGWSP